MIADVPHDHPLLVQFREDPYPLNRYPHAAAPVQWNDVLGAWTLARYADVVLSLTDPRFSADRTFQSEPEALDGYQLAKSMLVSGPPDHTRMRALVSKAFTPRMVEHLRPRVLSIVRELLDRVAERGDVLSEPELVVMCTLLLIAGHETTVNLIGNGVLALLQHPEALAAVRRTRPVSGRIVVDRVQIGGYDIGPGEWVLPLLGAANRDPAQFASPDELDLARAPNPHVAFGRGIHFCLGAPLARLEGQIAIGALVQRFSTLRLAAPPVRRDQITLRGLKSLPLSIAS